MPTVHIDTPHDNWEISTIEDRLRRIFPEDSFYLKNPEGSNARSDQLVSTFRSDWAKYQGNSVDSYKKKAGETQTVNVNDSYQVKTLKRNAADACGIPPAAIALKIPPESRKGEEMQVSSFRGYFYG